MNKEVREFSNSGDYLGCFTLLLGLILGYIFVGYIIQNGDPLIGESGLDWIGYAFGLYLMLPIVIAYMVAKIIDYLLGLLQKLFVRKKRGLNSSTSSKSKSYKQRPDINWGKWFYNKIVAPIIVGSVLGCVSFVVTGEWMIGGTTSLISFIMALLSAQS